MSNFYLATVAAVVVTTSLASNVLVVGTRGPVGSGWAERMRAAVHRWLRRFKHAIDVWVAAMIANRERQAAIYALHQLSDRELRDMGLDRGSIGHLVRYPQQWSLQANARPRGSQGFQWTGCSICSTCPRSNSRRSDSSSCSPRSS